MNLVISNDRLDSMIWALVQAGDVRREEMREQGLLIVVDVCDMG